MGPETQYEVQITDRGAITTTGDKGGWAPGVKPATIRAVGFLVTTAVAGGDAAVIKFDKVPAAGGTRGDGDVAVLNIPAGQAVGKVIYKAGLSVVLKPGDSVIADVTDASTAGAGSVIMFIEPIEEQPANLTHMILTT